MKLKDKVGVWNINFQDKERYSHEAKHDIPLERKTFNRRRYPFISGHTTKHDVNTFEVVVLADQFIPEVDKFKAKIKIAHLEEPHSVVPHIYQYTLLNHSKFDLIITSDEQFVGFNEKFVYAPVGMSMLKRKDFKIYDKSKNVSIVASKKNWLVGHTLRHEVIRELGHKIDGVKQGDPVEYKMPWMKDFRYSIAIENCIRNSYFTEKIMDCFKTGTIPIYWGCDVVNDVFNPDGILTFSSLSELSDILDNISPRDYEGRMDAIEDNFYRADEYLHDYDWMWQNGIKELWEKHKKEWRSPFA